MTLLKKVVEFSFFVIGLFAFPVFSCNLGDPQLVKWAKNRVEALGGCTALSGGSSPVSYKVPNVKLILYHSDEHEMLADFLQYNSYVFGFKSIVVIDQQSQMEPVCRTLALFQHCGTEVIATNDSFLVKGKTLTKVMRRYKHTYLIPLDADELILPFAPNSTSLVTVDRDALWAAFKQLHIDGRKYKFAYYTAAVPRESTCEESFANVEAEFRRCIKNDDYFPLASAPFSMSKTFFYSQGFISTDDGNHHGEVVHDRRKTARHPEVEKNLTRYFSVLNAQMLHVQLGGYRGKKDKYIRASEHMGFTGDSNCSFPRVGFQYCIPCKLFINGTDHGAKFYRDSCVRKPNAYFYTPVADWFRKNAMSMLNMTEMKDLRGAVV